MQDSIFYKILEFSCLWLYFTNNRSFRSDSVRLLTLELCSTSTSKRDRCRWRNKPGSCDQQHDHHTKLNWACHVLSDWPWNPDHSCGCHGLRNVLTLFWSICPLSGLADVLACVSVGDKPWTHQSRDEIITTGEVLAWLLFWLLCLLFSLELFPVFT